MYIVYFGIWKDLVLLKKMLFKDTLFHNFEMTRWLKNKGCVNCPVNDSGGFFNLVPYRTGHIHPTHLYQYSSTVLNVSS